MVRLTHSTGVQSVGNDPRVVPPVRHLTSYHFHPVAERRQGNKLPPHKSRWTGFGSEQPEFVARNTATQKSVHRKDRIKNPLELKF